VAIVNQAYNSMSSSIILLRSKIFSFCSLIFCIRSFNSFSFSGSTSFTFSSVKKIKKHVDVVLLLKSCACKLYCPCISILYMLPCAAEDAYSSICSKQHISHKISKLFYSLSIVLFCETTLPNCSSFLLVYAWVGMGL